jgi:hypothetical protein
LCAFEPNIWLYLIQIYLDTGQDVQLWDMIELILKYLNGQSKRPMVELRIGAIEFVKC